MKDILDRVQPSRNFKGCTWREFIEHITDYFIPEYVQPLGLVNQSGILFDNFDKRYGQGSDLYNLKNNISEFLKDVVDYPNSEIYIQTSLKTRIPKELRQLVIDKIKEVSE